jgi:hypothetical protein
MTDVTEHVSRTEDKGTLIITGHDPIDVFYEIEIEQTIVKRPNIRSVPGNHGIAGIIWIAPETLLSLGIQFPINAILRQSTGVRWAIRLNSDGSFIADIAL